MQREPLVPSRARLAVIETLGLLCFLRWLLSAVAQDGRLPWAATAAPHPYTSPTRKSDREHG
jgi:hypothetical protein